MTPVEQAAAVYEREDCARCFDDDMTDHLLHGFVFSTPDAFVMGRPVRRGAPVELILCPRFDFPTPDCWHIWLCAGDWRGCLAKHIPYSLPWISWEKRNRLRFWDLEKLVAKSV